MHMYFIRYKFSLIQLVVLLSILLVAFRLLINPSNMLTWDVFGYYLYLPAKFIYSDTGLSNQEWLQELMAKYQPSTTLYQLVHIENGNWVIKYTMGLSILYAPFFFLAHFIAEPLGYAADGLSLPYQYSLTLCGLVYAMIGLVFLSKILRHFFSRKTSAIVMILIFFGTNYFHLTIYDGTLLSHNFLFSFYSILIWYTIKWHKEPILNYAIVIGFALGFITLIRPTEAICILIPLLWSQKRLNYLNNKLYLFKTYYLHIIAASACAFIIIVPQLIYWKSISGEYLFYSYSNNAGEGLDFLSPHTLNFLFSFRKGWFIYTPIILFAFAGLIPLYKKKNKAIFYTIVIFIVLDIYLSSCWTTWWYAGGSFSSRSMVPAYALLAIPMGYITDSIRKSKSRVFWLIIALLLIALNLFQSWQFENYILDKERMTREYYFAIFGKTAVTDDDKKKLLVDRSSETAEGFNKVANNYEQKTLYRNNFDNVPNEQKVCVLNDKNQFSPGVNIKYSELTHQNHAWIIGSAKIFIPETYDEALPLFVASFHHKGKPYKYRTFEIKKSDILYNTWNTIELFYLTPEVRSKDDNLKIYIWHRGNKEILIDEINLFLYSPKQKY